MSEQEHQTTGSKGYYRKPHHLRRDCARLKMDQRAGDAFVLADYFCEMTLGWQARWVALSYDEIKYGKLLPNGTRLPETLSGLTDNKSIGRAISQLRDAGIIEIMQHPRYGTCYAIHKRYWLLLPAATRRPKWALFGLVPYDAARDPLDDAETPASSIMQPEDEEEEHTSSPADSIMQSGQFPHATEPVALRNRADSVKQSAISDEGGRQEGAGQRKDTSLDTSLKDTSGKGRAPGVMNQEEEDRREAPPDLVTLRIEYTTLSHQLAQLDVNKQAGQWARLYKQVQATEARLRQAEQGAASSQASPPADAQQQEAQASEGGTALPPAEGAIADERQARLRAVAGDLLYWKGGLKVLRQAQLPKWRGSFQWQIEARITALSAELARLRAEAANPDG